MIGDLHCHTTLSDGSLGIEDIIVQAKRTGVDFISITDHDTMSSISRAKVLGERYGIQTIPGVELSAWDKTRNRKVHILCYAPQKPDLDNVVKIVMDGCNGVVWLDDKQVTRLVCVKRYGATPGVEAWATWEEADNG